MLHVANAALETDVVQQYVMPPRQYTGGRRRVRRLVCTPTRVCSRTVSSPASANLAAHISVGRTSLVPVHRCELQVAFPQLAPCGVFPER